MYAIAKDNALVYHLLDTQTYSTMCGQKVSELPLDTEDQSGAFHAVSERPVDKMLCDACLAMDTPQSTSF
jgi:hypothetical protein